MFHPRHSGARDRSKGWLRLATLLSLMIVLSGCSGLFTGGADPGPGVFSLSGFVYDESNPSQPVSGATVRLGSEARTTGEDGGYSFTNVPVDGTELPYVVSAPGYVDYAAPIVIEAGQTLVRDVFLKKSEEQTHPGGDGGAGDDEGNGNGGDGSEPDPGDGSVTPTEPTYEGNVEVSIKIINAPVGSTAASVDPPVTGFEAVRPVNVLRRTSVDDHVPGQWIVETSDPEAFQASVEDNLPPAAAARVRVERRLSDDFFLLTGDESRAGEIEENLTALPGVVSVGRNRLVSPVGVAPASGAFTGPVTPNDEYYFRQWSLPLIGAPYAWSLTTGSPDVVVAVLDTGLIAHDDIRQNRLVHGRNFVSDQSATNYRDNTNNFSHGAMVAGIIGANSNNGTGVAGLNWDVTIMPVRVMGSNGGGSISGVGDGIKWAVDNGAHIINMSLAWDGNPSDPGERYVRQQIERAVASGVTLIAGAGNDSGRVTMPAAHPDVIAVGAVDKYKRYTWYTNFGSELDIVAPGGDQPTDALYRDGILSTDIANGSPYYTYSIGTSFASPHVTGVAALMYSRGITDPTEIREILLDTAEDLGTPGFDVYYGHGLVNAYAAVAGIRRTDAVAGVAFPDGRVFGPVQAEGAGDDVSALVDGVAPGRQTVFAWIDVNGDGRLDEGDFAAVGAVNVPEKGTVRTELHLQVVDTLSAADKQRLKAVVNR